MNSYHSTSQVIYSEEAEANDTVTVKHTSSCSSVNLSSPSSTYLRSAAARNVCIGKFWAENRYNSSCYKNSFIPHVFLLSGLPNNVRVPLYDSYTKGRITQFLTFFILQNFPSWMTSSHQVTMIGCIDLSVARFIVSFFSPSCHSLRYFIPLFVYIFSWLRSATVSFVIGIGAIVRYCLLSLQWQRRIKCMRAKLLPL